WSIPPGSTTTTVTVPVSGDTTFEPDETFTATLSGLVNGGGGDLQATGRILNDDLPVVRVNDPVAVTEGTGAGTTNLTFTVTLDGPAQAPASVTVATADGTATSPADYTAISPTVVAFAPGEQSKTVTVTITRDNIDESTESFTLGLSSPSGLTIGDATGTGTITDDDAVPAPIITGLVPSSGPSQGGTQVTIVGHNLATATQVTINNQPVAFVVSGTVLVFTTPASLPGTATVLVTTPGGTSAPNPASTFTYQ
ncbi:MAG: Calx-beta domain-containing protein, partial [Acidimicrobiia bacterium]